MYVVIATRIIESSKGSARPFVKSCPMCVGRLQVHSHCFSDRSAKCLLHQSRLMVEDEFACANNWDMLFTMQTIGLYADIYSRFMQAYSGCEL